MLNLRNFLNPAFLKLKPHRDAIEALRAHLLQLPGRTVFLFVVTLLIIGLFGGCGLFRPDTPDMAEEEYAVIKKIMLNSSHYLPPVHVVDHSRIVQNREDMEDQLQGADDIADTRPWLELLDPFLEINGTAAVIDSSFLSEWLQYISPEEVKGFEGLVDYHTQYPENTGYIWLSRPVFNDSGDSAIAAFSFYSALMNCPSPIRHMYLLVKEEEWQIYRAFSYYPTAFESNGSWLQALIDNAENGPGPPYTQAVWSYEYQGDLVYYTLALPGHDYNYIYDSSGTCLGAPDGGWRNGGDGNLPDFFENAENKTLIWVRNVPQITGASEEYRIINAALECVFPRRDYLHLIGTTHAYTEYFSYKYELDDGNIEYDSLMLEDYLSNNREPLTLDKTYLNDVVHTVPRAELDSLWEQYEYPLDWQEYYRRYPFSNGHIEISRPGIAPDDSMAVMTLGWQFAGDGGQGYMLVFIRIDGKWIARWRFGTWVS
ncbi:MAG: hypothetical protein U5N26_01175 [Candidatus Marinimicrobia bacterium]|nr:hypothetical protein [Candidatus Neomarinimicrobiota bacterium]